MTEKEELSPGYREECYVCRRARVNCLCGAVKPFPTRMRFVILMHTKEDRRQRTGTARLARLCLTNSELLVGEDFTRNERVNALLRDPAFTPVVLYPGPKALSFKAHAAALPGPGKTLLVFVLDGTWACAKRILNKSRNLQALPRLSFSGSYVSRFTIKKQPMEHCVSTIEAVYYLCREAEAAGREDLGGQPEVLLEIFKKLVDIQLAHQEKAGREQRARSPKATRGDRGRK